MMSNRTSDQRNRTGGIKDALLGLLLLMLSASPTVGLAASAQLQDIEVTGLPGDTVEVRLSLDAAIAEPLSFTIDEPARIAVDLLDTGLALSNRSRQVNVGPLRSVLTAEAAGRTRVVFNLERMVPYTVTQQGDDVVVTLSPGSAPATFNASSRPAASSSTPSTPAASAPTTRSTASSSRRSVDSVDFRRGADGEGRVLIDLSDPNTAVDVSQEGTAVIVTLSGTDARSQLQRRLDVTDFATPVQTIDTMMRGEDTRIVIRGAGAFEHIAYQSDDDLTIELREYVEPEEEFQTLEEKEYTGDRITLNFQDIETRTVLQILADISGLNVVVSDSVAGNLTLRLQNVPWDQALDIVMRTKGLDMRQNGNVMLIAPAEEIAAREQLALENRQKISELEPLRSEFIQVNYTKAASLKELLESASADNSLLSSRGSVSMDERTNTLLVRDTAERLEDIRRLVRTLDVPVRQVQIESRIVIANDDFTRDLGVRMGVTGVSSNGSDGLIAVSGSLEGNDAMIQQGLANLQSSGTPFPVGVPALEDRLSVNLPTSSTGGRLSASILGSDYLVDLELSALQAEGKGEVVSAPRIITTNQKQATIEQGVEIPYQEASASGATATQFKKAVLALDVTPQITPDDRIIMDLTVKKDSVGQQVPSATGGFVPSIDTRELTTQVLVNNGDTVVLGGVYEIETSETENKVPMLGDIPILGHLFKSKRDLADKAELLIFVTPKIIKDDQR